MRRVAVLVSLAVFGAGCTGQLRLPGASGSGGSGIDPGTDGGGSGTGGFDGTIGQGGGNGSGGAAGASPICTAPQVLLKISNRHIADLLLVVGRNSSMAAALGNTTTTRMAAVQASLHDIVMANQNAINFGYLEFPSSNSCMNGVMCCAEDPMLGVSPSPLSFNGIAAALQKCNGPGCVSDSDSRPIADAFRAAWSVLSPSNTADQRAILLTDGAPSCIGFEDSATSCSTARSQLNQQLSRNGVMTYVVTIGQDAEQGMCLRNIALDGAGNTLPFQARDPNQLTVSLKQIVSDVASGACTLDLQSVPPDHEKVSVKINGVPIPKDNTGQNGWKYNQAFSQIQVYGDSCVTVQAANAKDIQVWSGCPP